MINKEDYLLAHLTADGIEGVVDYDFVVVGYPYTVDSLPVIKGCTWVNNGLIKNTNCLAYASVPTDELEVVAVTEAEDELTLVVTNVVDTPVANSGETAPTPPAPDADIPDVPVKDAPKEAPPKEDPKVSGEVKGHK